MNEEAQPTIEIGLAAIGREILIASRRIGTTDELGSGRVRADALVHEVARQVAALDGRPADVRRLRIDRGPGSYTGLRAMMTFARTLAAADVARVEVQVFDAFARLAAATSREQSVFRVVLDARRDRVFTARVETSPESVRVIDAPAAVDLDELSRRTSADEVLLVAGDEKRLGEAWLAVGRCGIVDAPATTANDLFDPRVVARSLTADEPSGWQPLYLMGSYADPA